MSAIELVRQHGQWLAGKAEKPDLRGADLRRADLRGADLRGASLHGADLRGANLNGANLRGASLHGANLREANLNGADLRWADLRGADLRGADLNKADLREADLSGVDLYRAELSGAELSGTDLSGAGLRWANLYKADLYGADLRKADLREADLRRADLSQTKGLLMASEWLQKHFRTDELGFIVYKAIGNTYYSPPDKWNIKKGAILSETCNRCPTDPCGCGVNFATLDWIKSAMIGREIWKCRISWIDLADVCVPYNTDGKARCARLTLVEKVKS